MCQTFMNSASLLPSLLHSSLYYYQGSYYRSLFSLSADKRVRLACESIDLSPADILPVENDV